MSIELTVHGVSLQYDSHRILENLEFQVEPGQRVALLGANGAGKSTLLRCIGKAVRPNAGSVLIDGQDVKKLSARALAQTMAVVPQETRADFDFTVQEAVMMGRLPFLSRFQQEGDGERLAAQEAMSATGTSHLAQRSIATLSGGEKQRVVIARALCQEPKLLLLDEPTANLDLGYQHSLMDLIAQLNTVKGITVIAAIHDLNLAARYFDSMILLHKGRVLAAGPADAVLVSESIQQAYGVDAFTYRHPLTGSLQVGVRDQQQLDRTSHPLVHVIGGGEAAIPVLEHLRRQGCRLSVGPVSAEDSGFRFASFYALPVIEVPPFSPISDQTHQDHLQMCQAADLTVVPPIPFGRGNIRNLEAVLRTCHQGKPVAILARPGNQQDFTNGRADAIFQQLRANGAVDVAASVDLSKLLETIYSAQRKNG